MAWFMSGPTEWLNFLSLLLFQVLGGRSSGFGTSKSSYLSLQMPPGACACMIRLCLVGSKMICLGILPSLHSLSCVVGCGLALFAVV